MGTSKSLKTPSGGGWTDVKRKITSYLSGGGGITPRQIVGSTIAALGGLDSQPDTEVSGKGGRLASESPRGRNSVSRVLSKFGGFGETLRSNGLTQALNTLGLLELEGKSAGEVIGLIADQLASEGIGRDQDFIRDALQQTLLNASEFMDNPSYENLESSLEAFISQEGVEGLLRLFLTQYVFIDVWHFIEDHVNKRTNNQHQIDSTAASVEHACREIVKYEIEEHLQAGTFNHLDWFGNDGIEVADKIVNELVQKLLIAQGGTE